MKSDLIFPTVLAISIGVGAICTMGCLAACMLSSVISRQEEQKNIQEEENTDEKI
jgi:hypothetical protein